MDCDEPMVQPNGDFIGWIGFVLHPVAHITKQRRHFGVDAVGVDPDIARRRTASSRPFPYIAEHALMQVQRKFDTQNVLRFFSAKESLCPHSTRQDILLLRLVEVAPMGDRSPSRSSGSSGVAPSGSAKTSFTPPPTDHAP